jgi:BTB/POZ domain-containing protein KCTD9
MKRLFNKIVSWDIFSKMKKPLNQFVTWYLFPPFIALIIALPLVITLSIKYLYPENDALKGILTEAHGMIFDIIIVVILISLLNKRIENKLEIKRYLEEIDDYRGWDSQEASQRVSGIIRRLDKINKSEGLDLHNCTLIKAQLLKINLQGANFRNTLLTRANLRGSNLQRAHLSGATIAKADLFHANLKNASLSYSNLRSCYLREADMQYADLTKSDLDMANLRGSNLKDAILIEANFHGADLIKVNFQNANLFRANLNASDINLYQLKYVKSLDNSVMPDGTTYNEEWKKKIDEAEVTEEYLKKWDLKLS